MDMSACITGSAFRETRISSLPPIASCHNNVLTLWFFDYRGIYLKDLASVMNLSRRKIIMRHGKQA
jgi:hypothetical protein